MVGGGDGGASERPMRRSRMLSDDARLALQLQDEELKAARGMKRVKHAAARDALSWLTADSVRSVHPYLIHSST